MNQHCTELREEKNSAELSYFIAYLKQAHANLLPLTTLTSCTTFSKIMPHV